MNFNHTKGLRGRPLLERFEEKFRKTPGCWEWLASRLPFGYGQIMINKRPRVAHRISYSLYVGPIPDGMQVLHKCDNPPCVNPDHLWIGTHADNMKDKVLKGRSNNKEKGSPGEKNGRAKLTEINVRNIRSSTEQTKILAARYGVERTRIQKIRSNSSWKHLLQQ